MRLRIRIFIYVFLSSVLIIIGMSLAGYYWFSNFHLRKSIDYEKKMVRLSKFGLLETVLKVIQPNELVELYKVGT